MGQAKTSEFQENFHLKTHSNPPKIIQTVENIIIKDFGIISKDQIPTEFFNRGV